jgi:gamma-glutamyl:cysteine ligase YbdK (ATP-grasp superfamily)
MEKLIFNKSPDPTIGVEIEIQILDPETFELRSIAPEILKMVPSSLNGRIKPEGRNQHGNLRHNVRCGK